MVILVSIPHSEDIHKRVRQLFRQDYEGAIRMRSLCDDSRRGIARIPVDWNPKEITGEWNVFMYGEFEGRILGYDPATRRALEYVSFYPLEEIPFGD